MNEKSEVKNTRTCPLCMGAKVEVRLCPFCHGEGCGACGHKRVFTRTCTMCYGTGKDPVEVEFPVIESDPELDDINKC